VDVAYSTAVGIGVRYGDFLEIHNNGLLGDGKIESFYLDV